jgi:predicted HAD superfamily Cof-like phosphohydrolase
MKLHELVAKWRAEAEQMSKRNPVTGKHEPGDIAEALTLEECANALEQADEYVQDNDPEAGKEAEKLRSGVEALIEEYAGVRDEIPSVLNDLQSLLDRVDARDSLKYLERKEEGVQHRASREPLPGERRMEHLMRDMEQLHLAFGHPVLEEPVPPDDINDLVDDDVNLSSKREMQERLMLRLRLVAEEFFELLKGAVGNGPQHLVEAAKGNIDTVLDKWRDNYDYNAIETADALTDLMVVTVGMGLELGMPLDRLWDEVHRSNMAKVGPDGKVTYREDGKVLKPEGWTPPDIKAALYDSKHAPELKKRLSAMFGTAPKVSLERAATALGVDLSNANHLGYSKPYKKMEVKVLLDNEELRTLRLAQVDIASDERGEVVILGKLAAENL